MKIRNIIFALMLIAAALCAVIAWKGQSDNFIEKSIVNNRMPDLTDKAAVEYLKQNGEYDSLMEAVNAAQYHIFEMPQQQSKKQSLIANNPAQRFSARFAPERIEIVTADRNSPESAPLSLRLQSYGYGERQMQLGAGEMTATDNRLEIKRTVSGMASEHTQTISEWYINSESGLEQGFTLDRAPIRRQKSDELKLLLKVEGASIQMATDKPAIELKLDCGGELRYDKLLAWDATGKKLAARMMREADGIALLVNDTDAVYPLTIDPLFSQVKKISGIETSSEFGAAVAISKDTVVIGAPLSNGLLFTDAGLAFVFTRNQGGADNWGQVQLLLASDGNSFDYFGTSVAIDGDLIVIGSPGHDLSTSMERGAAYLFERNQGGANNWGQLKKLTASDGAASDEFGKSVGISDHLIVVGADGDDSGQGAAYLFERNQGGANNWGQLKKLTDTTRVNDDRFGAAVAISGDTVAIGVPTKDTPLLLNVGAAVIFAANTGGANNFGLVTRLMASDGLSGTQFGNAIAIDCDRVVVGASRKEVNAGAVYIFERNHGGIAGGYQQVQKLTASDGNSGDNFGCSVSISEDMVLVGALNQNSQQGAAYLFERNQGGADNWGEIKKYTASDGAGGDLFGRAVAIDKMSFIIGAKGDNGTGSAYVFANPCSQYQQVKIGKTGSLESPAELGSSISISGNTAVVGGITAAVPVDADGRARFGGAFIFERNAGGAENWGITKVLGEGLGRIGDQDEYGFSVSIYCDTIVVGAPIYDVPPNVLQDGTIYIYERNQGGRDNWGRVKQINSPNAPELTGAFGYSVSVYGDNLVVGAPGENSQFGNAFVYKRNQGGANNWGLEKTLSRSDSAASSAFGVSVSLYGDTCAVAATGGSRGVYLYERNQGGVNNWGEIKKLTISGALAFGQRVALDNSTLVVADPGDAGLHGAAYIFERNQGGANNWGQVQKLTTPSGQLFGQSLAIHGDKVVVGSSWENNKRGAAYVFERNQGGADNWGQVQRLIASDGQTEDEFGFSVGLGNQFIAVGAHFAGPKDLFGGFKEGAVYLYRVNCPPSIIVMPTTITRQRGTSTSAVLANLDDEITAPNSLTVSFSSLPTGVTFTNVMIDGNGQVTATVAASCTAALGTSTVQMTVTDAGGQSSMANLTVQVTTDAAPVFTCANISAGTTSNACSAVVNFTPSVVDSCDGALTPTCVPSSGSTFAKGITTVTCTATDSSGNVGQCAFTVTVVDDDAPAINCPSPVVVNTATGQCSAVATFAATATDNCSGSLTPSCMPLSGSTFAKGITTVTCTATDAASNSSQCQFTVTVNDNQGPTINCPANITAPASAGSCTAVVTFTPTASDSCDGARAPSCTPASGSTFSIGVTTVTCTATDTAGNSSPCSFTVTVNDTQPPVLNCPANIQRNTDLNQCSAVVTYTAPTATDNCSGVGATTCTPPSGSTFAKGTTTVSCTVTDAAGNTGNCSFTVTVSDAQKPTLNCPANITAPTALNSCSATVTFTSTATDNCDTNLSPSCSPASGSTFAKGTTTVTCSVSDAAGNNSTCSFTVTVNDTQKPAISCPANITQAADLNKCSTTVTFSASATDNCDAKVTPSCTPPSGSVFAKGTTVVTCSVSDAAGNTANCSFNVTVVDSQKPVIACPANITVPNALNTCGAPVSFAPTASDNCAVQSLVCVPPSASVFAVGATMVTCTATDTSGNSQSCSFTVTVNDIQLPVIDCPANITSTTVNPGDATVTVTYPAPNASDNCAIQSIVCVPPSGASFPLGTTTVTCTATDVAGNQSSCSFTVTTFDVCLQDDSNVSAVLFWNSKTGDYLFCCGTTRVGGKGAATRQGNLFKLTHQPADRRLAAQLDATMFRGSASLQMPVGITACSITDRDTRNNSCRCQQNQ
ncbi:MAG: HYR domain-containing protein [Acidobacteriota bacterium]